jgi:hypothetical protein
MDAYSRYRIDLDGEWTLEDLYKFPRAYEQVYFFFASVDEDISVSDRERIARAFASFPWQGGYSAVTFFNHLKYAVDRRRRPRIAAIHKASPGFMELLLLVSIALAIAKVVKSLCSAADAAHNTYNAIYRGMQERKLLKLKVDRATLQFDKEHIDFIESSSRQMAKLLGIPSPSRINALAGSPYLTLKILLSVYRRARTLVEYEQRGKLILRKSPEPASRFWTGR